MNSLVMKPKVAYFSPLPPIRSGIADYSAVLIPYLKRYVDLTLFTDQAERPDWPDLEIKPIAAIHDEWWRYDLLLYHMGNSLHHGAIYEVATQYSGVVVLHDHGIHHFVTEFADDKERPGIYTRELAYSQGRAGGEMVWQSRRGEAAVDLFADPLNQRLIDSSRGLVVHSEYVRQQIVAARPELPVQVISMLDMVEDPASIRPFSKLSIGLSPDTIVIASAGQITPNKQIDLMLRTMAKLREEMTFVHYLIIGEAVAEVGLAQQVEELGLEGMVTQTGFIDGYEPFLRWLKTADVLVNLRYPTLGETSSVVLQGLALGLPVIVFNHGWYREIDSNACVKVPVMDEFALYEYLQALAADNTTRRAIGSRARDLIWRDHRPDHVAQVYGRFASEMVGKRLFR